MKTIIAGGRDIHDQGHVDQAVINSGFAITEVVCGGATGVDQCGAYWGDNNKVPVKYFNADWGAHGKAAGPIRNRQMAEYADALILVWDGESRGSANMLSEATKRGLKVHEQVVS